MSTVHAEQMSSQVFELKSCLTYENEMMQLFL